MRAKPGFIWSQENILGRRPEPPLVGAGLPPGGRCHHLPLGNPLVSPAVRPADPGQDIPGEGGAGEGGDGHQQARRDCLPGHGLGGTPSLALAYLRLQLNILTNQNDNCQYSMEMYENKGDHVTSSMSVPSFS